MSSATQEQEQTSESTDDIASSQRCVFARVANTVVNLLLCSRGTLAIFSQWAGQVGQLATAACNVIPTIPIAPTGTSTTSHPADHERSSNYNTRTNTISSPVQLPQTQVADTIYNPATTLHSTGDNAIELTDGESVTREYWTYSSSVLAIQTNDAAAPPMFDDTTNAVASHAVSGRLPVDDEEYMRINGPVIDAICRVYGAEPWPTSDIANGRARGRDIGEGAFRGSDNNTLTATEAAISTRATVHEVASTGSIAPTVAYEAQSPFDFAPASTSITSDACAFQQLLAMKGPQHACLPYVL